MAFTGTAVVTQISDSIVHITGLSLASAASGTIGLFPNTGTGESAPNIRLPEAFQPKNYTYAGSSVPLVDSIDVTATIAATGVATAIPIAVVKSGSTDADFLATLTNTHGTLTSPTVEIYVKFHE